MTKPGKRLKHFCSLIPSDVRFIRLYVRIIIACDAPITTAFDLLNNYLDQHPDDVDVILDISELYLQQENPREADVLFEARIYQRRAGRPEPVAIPG